MNLLARNDLTVAFVAVKSLCSTNTRTSSDFGILAEATLKLCHVCQALAEENEELRKALRDHTNRQDAHNF